MWVFGKFRLDWRELFLKNGGFIDFGCQKNWHFIEIFTTRFLKGWDNMRKRQLFMLLALLIIGIISFTGCTSDSDDGGTVSPSPLPTTTTTPSPQPTGNGIITGTVADDGGTALAGAQVTIDFYEPDTSSASDRLVGETTTDAQGGFSFNGLATGYEYVIVVSYSGKVTTHTIFMLSDTQLEKSFELLLPNGSGEAEFYLPNPVYLAGSIKNSKADLSWGSTQPSSSSQSSSDRLIAFDRFLIFRSNSAGVAASDTLVYEGDVQTTNSYMDQMPGLGTYYYKLFKKFIDSNSGVVIFMVSNEVEIGYPKMVYKSQFGVPGTNPGEFISPYDVAVEESNGAVTAIYVADIGNNRVQKLNPDGTPLATPVEYPVPAPRAVALAPDGTLYVLTTPRVYVFYTDGTSDIWGDDPGELLFNSNYLATGRNQAGDSYYIYADDPVNYRIMKVNPDGTLDGYLTPNLPELLPGTFQAFSFATDVDGNLFISAYSTQFESSITFPYFSIMKFDSSGNFEGQFARTIAIGYSSPPFSGTAVSPYGDVFTAFTSYYWIGRYSSAGALLQGLGNQGVPGTGDGEFISAFGIACDSQGNLYVADTGNNRIQVFASQQ